MTTRLPFTEAAIRRVWNAGRKAGLDIAATRILPDGTIEVVHTGVVSPIATTQNGVSKWLDVEA
jgi:hypothetical protein